jgi:pyruvate/2-oxoglutarate dehydrogenase complex dihydrolipoamide dehydrogenase (E3) component
MRRQEGNRSMIEVFKTNDPVRLSYAEAILREAGIEPVVLDAQTAGLFGGALPWIKRRMLVDEASAGRAKTLLDAAARRAVGADYPWERASARRDWMISREERNRPDDAGHVQRLESAGAEVIRGTARLVGAGAVEVRNGGSPRTLETEALILAIGSTPVVPDIEGLEEAGYWTSDDATSTRELPSSIVVMGGGVVGVEMAQVFARFGVKTTLVQGNERILPRDHPRSSALLADQLREEGVDIRTNVTATAVANGGAGRRVTLSDGTEVEGAQILVAVGRRAAALGALGVEEAAVRLDGRGVARPDDRMAVGDGIYVAGDCAGGAQFTHVADYEGRIAARAAAGRDVRADLATIPAVTFTDPETATVGLTVEAARERGVDAFEVTVDFATTARGFTIEPRRRSDTAILEGSPGHITAVVDRDRRILVGAFAACPGAGELIHEPVLAIKARVPVDVLADTIHAFPTGARAFGNLMAEARDRVDAAE